MRANVDFAVTGWHDLLPAQRTLLITTIAHATAAEVDGTLDQVYAALAWQHTPPALLDGPLWWSLSDDPGDVADGDSRRDLFNTAVGKLGLVPPRTLRDLHHVLAAVGVLSRTVAGGTERWRIPDVLPLPEDVLPMPAEWVEQAVEARWTAAHAATEVAIVRYLADELPEVEQVLTSIQQLATRTFQDVESVRQALPGLLASRELRLLDGGLEDVDPLTAGDDAPLLLIPDWGRIYECREHMFVFVDDDGN